MLRKDIIPDRYRPRNLFQALKNPRVIRNECNRLGLQANRAYYRFRKHDGINVPAADWDVLVILDGCRYDLFEDVYESLVEGREADLRQVTSGGSNSQEFLETNFGDGKFYDTVYVSANPFIFRNEDQVFHAVRNLLLSAWDETLGTVPPAAVAQAAIEWLDAYPNKRMIVHFMQPHYPFIGERGRQLDHRKLSPADVRGLTDEGEHQPSVEGKRIWGRLKDGEVTRNHLWTCYQENLEVALPHVATVLDATDGKSVVTADHGNLFGERLWPIPVRGYGHPGGIYVPELVEVPWLSFVADERQHAIAEPPESNQSIDQKELTDKLAHLGYR